VPILGDGRMTEQRSCQRLGKTDYTDGDEPSGAT
jgi:hypothetical protein